MPIRTRYQIYCSSKKAALLDTTDRDIARVEFNEYIRNPKGDVYRMVQTLEPVGALTKQEEYLMLVYRVRKLIRQYYDRGRKHEDLMASLEHEQNLDDWNKRTQQFIDTHPGYKPQDAQSHAFYVLVSEWRKVWHERMAYRKRKMGFDQRVLDEMTKKCRALEKQVDQTIREKLRLL